jgi:hypothetical protein
MVSQYFKAIEDLHAPDAAPLEAAPMAAPPPPVVPLDAQQWEQRLGPVTGPDNDFEVPEGSAWDSHVLNTAQSAFTSHGFPAAIVDDFADAERQMAATTWTEEEGRAALAATHGPATAQQMIHRAQTMLELVHEHELGRQRIARWEQNGGLNHPALIEALSNALNAQPRDNDRYMDLVLKRAARWEARRRGQTA